MMPIFISMVANVKLLLSLHHYVFFFATSSTYIVEIHAPYDGYCLHYIFPYRDNILG